MAIGAKSFGAEAPPTETSRLRGT
ncbi:DUF6053 domain-containing protein [Lysobacter sp. TAB13]